MAADGILKGFEIDEDFAEQIWAQTTLSLLNAFQVPIT
jgi:hypothetical protein